MSLALRPARVRQRRSHALLRTLPLPFMSEPAAAESPLSAKKSSQPAAPEKNSRPSLPQVSQPQDIFKPATSSTSATSTPELEPSPATGQTSELAPAALAQQALVAQLAREVQRIEVAGRVLPGQLGRSSRLFSSGCSEIDRCLPNGGYDSGTVVEYLQGCSGSGATTLALSVAREALRVATDRFCVLVDWRQQFYPPAAAALGIDLKRLVIVRPGSLAERLWAIDQALRSPAIVAVIAEVEHMDDRSARRLQLAAERGGGLGLLVRGVSSQQHPSWAEVQWRVRPLTANRSAHRQLELELVRARGGRPGARVRVQINASHGHLEPATAATAVLARTLAQPRPTTRPHPAAGMGTATGTYGRTYP